MTTDDQHPIVPWLTQRRRAYFYGIAVTAAPLAVFYGIVADKAAPLWVGLAGSVLGNGLAALHTPRQ